MFRLRQVFLVLLIVFSVYGGELTAEESIKGFTQVANDNCGISGGQPHLLSGSNYRYLEDVIPFDEIGEDDPLRSVAHGSRVSFGYSGLNPKAAYKIRVVCQTDNQKRIQKFVSSDHVLLENITIPNGEAVSKIIVIPEELYSDGNLVVEMIAVTGPNAVVSVIEVWSDDKTLLKPLKQMPLPQIEVPLLPPVPASVNGAATPKSSLNGTWRFNPAPVKDFMQQDKAEGSGWSDIKVPGQWVQQGFEVEVNTAAGYWREFTVPKKWQEKHIKIRFGAVYSDAVVWINGEKIGEHHGGFLPFEFDVTDNLKPGANVIAMSVASESLADSAANGSRYAMHQLGGIPKDIYMYPSAGLRFTDVGVVADLDKDYRDGQLNIDMTVASETDNVRGNVLARLSMRPLGIKGASWNEREYREIAVVKVPSLNKGKSFRKELSIAVDDPQLWHAEHPYLYELKFELISGSKEIESVVQRIGFRKIEVVGSQVFVNGHSLKLRGVCRHIIHPVYGRYVPEELIRKDVELFRNANCNFIRTSHYPPEEMLLDLCDEYGIFVMNEAPFCWSGGGSEDYVLKKTKELWQRDRNHPSVIIWSQANESGWQPMFEKSIKMLKQLDPSRLVMFSHSEYYGIQARGIVDIGTQHYPGHDGPKRYNNHIRPIIFDEYLHVNAYNERELVADPGVRDVWGNYIKTMWQDTRNSKAPLGGAIWGGVDEVFFLPADKVAGYGMWGIIDGWRREKPEYWHTKKSYSPFSVTRKSCMLEEGKVIVPVENRYDSISFEGLKIEWHYDGQSGTTSSGIPAGNTGNLIIALKQPYSPKGYLDLKVTDMQGFVIDTYKLPVGTISHEINKPSPIAGSLQLVTDDSKWAVSGDGFSYVFDRKSGLISKSMSDGMEVIVGGPHLMLLNHDNIKVRVEGNVPYMLEGHEDDAKTFYSPVCSGWQCQNASVVSSDDKEIKIKTVGEYQEAVGDFTYTIKADGSLDIEYAFRIKGDVSPRQVGLVLDINKTCDTLRWKRKGLWTTYPAHHIGRLEGTAKAFYDTKVPDIYGPRKLPDWPWSQDTIQFGSNDFRSTKHNIYSAALMTNDSTGIAVKSDGSHHVRSWVSADCVHLLVAYYSNGGSEHYLSYQSEKDILKWGENTHHKSVSDQVELRLK